MRNAGVLACVVVILGLAGCDSNDTGTGGSSGHTTAASTGGAGGTGGGGDGPIEARFQPLADAVEAELGVTGAPGAAVAVIEGGKVTFAHGFGMKQAGGMDPVDSRTLFRIGSCTKMLTTAAFLHQVGEGKVDISESVTEKLPDFDLSDPSWAPSIHIEHLLTHTSAMSDFIKVDVPSSQQTDQALHDYLTGSGFKQNDYLMAPPGAFFNYSNPNFYFTGLLAETTAGVPYREVLKNEVFDPLGMSRTFFLASDVLADGNYALGATTAQGVADPVLPDTYENAWARPAGYASSNVHDLARFVTFLRDGNPAVVPDDLRQQMMTAHVSTAEYGDLIHYGYGLFVEDGFFIGDSNHFYPVPMIEHGGDIPGFAADVYYVPSLDFGLVVLANADGAHLGDSLGVALSTLTTLPATGTPPDVTPDPSTFALYAGDYQDDFNAGAVSVTQVGNGLQISMPKLDAANIPYQKNLVPYARETFILDVQGTQVPLSFLKDESGEIHYLRTRFFVANRVEGEPLSLSIAPEQAAEQTKRLREAIDGYRLERHGVLPVPSNLGR